MTSNSLGNAFSFEQFSQRKAPGPPIPRNTLNSHPLDSPHQQRHTDAQLYLAKINHTTKNIKKKTIDLVKTLRQYSLPGNLEAQIECYLTDVLDEMDVLQASGASEIPKPHFSQLTEEAVPFFQVEELAGDQEDCYLEDTLKQLHNHNNCRAKKQQTELHDKIQHILKSISEVSMEEQMISEQKRNKPEVVEPQPVSESKIKGAHRFSQLYIRDIQKNTKKPKLL